MKIWKRLALLSLCLCLSGCGANSAEQILDPKHPTTVVLWNYYNGQTKSAFDQLVAQFNETVGMERGIVVDTVSHGDIQQLASAVYAAASQSLGAEAMPHLFAGYPDNVYRVDQLGLVADLGQYFTEEELAAYRQDFLQDCYLGGDNGLKVIPAARSTDILYLNATDWEPFAQATGAELSRLATWEGLAETAADYYRWTDAQTPQPDDGKAFFGLDSLANFIIISSMQLGCPVYEVEGETVSFSFDQTFARALWDSVYIPYLNGHYANYGRFRSDDERTGDILAYLGSSAGAQYFPAEVALNSEQTYPVEGLTLPYPRFAGGEAYAVAQGAGFAVSKSDAAHEYASVLFLKWFTAPEQNRRFAVASGYLPVQNAALTQDLAAEARQYNDSYADSPTVALSIATTQDMLERYRLYANRSFDGSYDLRALMDASLTERINRDLERVEEQVRGGMPRAAAVAQYTGDEGFQDWYEDFMARADDILGK